MNETLYHSDIRLPDWFVKPTQRVTLSWSRHALRAASDDRYGVIPVQDMMTLEWYDVIEVGVVDEKVSKIVFRGGLDRYRDIVIVLSPMGGNVWKVRTCWVNLKTDAHKTLDKSKYIN